MQNLDYFTISKENVVTYFIDDLMIAGPGKQPVVGALDALVGNM